MLEALRKQWAARQPRAPIADSLRFDGADVVLGAGTRIAGRSGDIDRRAIALLSTAYRKYIDQSAFRHLRRALHSRANSDDPLALIHLALTGLGKLEQPQDDSRRLFMADGLMKAGVAPEIILNALELDGSDSGALDRAYNPDQPRVPAGSGRESGQWAGNAVSSVYSETKTPSVLMIAAEQSEEMDEEENREEDDNAEPGGPRLSERLQRDLEERGIITEFAGISVWATARVNNGVAIYEVGGLYAPEDDPQNLFRFVRELDQTSWQLGARSVRIYGFGIINQRLFNPRVARRLGFTYELLDSGSVVRLTKTLYGDE
jgi:hypothetical protein